MWLTANRVTIIVRKKNGTTRKRNKNEVCLFMEELESAKLEESRPWN
jgi:hypothetical protein